MSDPLFLRAVRAHADESTLRVRPVDLILIFACGAVVAALAIFLPPLTLWAIFGSH